MVLYPLDRKSTLMNLTEEEMRNIEHEMSSIPLLLIYNFKPILILRTQGWVLRSRHGNDVYPSREPDPTPVL